MSQPADLERCAQAVMDAVPPVMRFIRAEMRRHGSPALSVPQFRTLNYLRRHAGASLSEVADHLGVTNATASNMVDRLVKGGLVDRVAASDERRRSVLTLTEAGADLLRVARSATRSQLAAALARLSAEEIDLVSRSMLLLESVFREVPAHEPDEL